METAPADEPLSGKKSAVADMMCRRRSVFLTAAAVGAALFVLESVGFAPLTGPLSMLATLEETAPWAMFVLIAVVGVVGGRVVDRRYRKRVTQRKPTAGQYHS